MDQTGRSRDWYSIDWYNIVYWYRYRRSFQTTIPHSYATTTCTMTNVLALRKKLIGDGVKISVNDFVIKAAATALQVCS